MGLLLKNASVFTGGGFSNVDVLIENGRISAMAPGLDWGGDTAVFDFKGKYIFPGFTDVHVHLREPGFSYKETIRTGTLAAVRGGYTAVCPMPNLSPVPDGMDNLQAELDIIKLDAAVRVFPYGAITRGERGDELSDMESMAPFVAGFSDDGRGVQSGGIMGDAMVKAKSLGKIIAAHCEDESLLPKGWSVNAGAAADRFGLVGNPSESEWRQVERDIELVRKTGCAYHVCHVSTKESVELIRRAKAQGLDVTCETGPHYLTITDGEIEDEGRFRMNPPIRGAEDRRALIEGILDGTVDMIATDHAPHSYEEKSGGLAGSLNGIVGLECAFPVLYTKLVLGGIIPLEKLIRLMSVSPAARFKLPGGEIKVGAPADLAIFDLDEEYTIKSDDFLSMGRSTPFEGWSVRGRCLATFVGGRPVWQYREAKDE